MRKILITGGAGNVGGSLAQRLVQDDSNFVVVVDNLLTGSLHKLPVGEKGNFKFIKANVNSFEEISSIMLSYKFDVVFHYAAVVGVQRTLANPLMVFDDIDGIKNILHLSKSTRVKRFFYSSSSEVYGEPVSLPQFEDSTPLNSRLPYAVVKNLGEAYLKAYHIEFALPYTIFRFFNTYGPGQSDDFVLPRFLKAALKGNDINIYGDGSQTRTFCYIDDNIDTTINILNNQLAINETLNVGNDIEISMLQLAKKIISLTASSSRIVFVDPLKEGDMTRRQPDISRMKNYLGRDLISLDAGLERLLEHYLKEKSFNFSTQNNE